MKRPFWTAAFCAAAAGTAIPALCAATSTPPVLLRLIALSSSVRSYTAHVQAHVAMHTFPFLSPTLTGTYYHKEPSRDKIVFTGGLPFVAEEFSKVYPHVESPSRWESVYVVTVHGDRDGVTTLHLVPRKHGRVDHIDARIADKSAELLSLKWIYSDGGYATLVQRYGVVGGHELVIRQNGHFQVPHYDADLISTFSGFRLNAHIPDSTFTQNS